MSVLPDQACGRASVQQELPGRVERDAVLPDPQLAGCIQSQHLNTSHISIILLYISFPFFLMIFSAGDLQSSISQNIR